MGRRGVWHPPRHLRTQASVPIPPNGGHSAASEPEHEHDRAVTAVPRRGDRDPASPGRHAPRLWPVWVVGLLALLLALAVGYGIYELLHSLASKEATPENPVAAHEVIRTALAALTFAGAVLAGVYAYRKQRLAESDAHRADDKQLAERLTTAADQLGHDQAAVRLAGVYAMARLADDWIEQRQVCVDAPTTPSTYLLVCVQLRLPRYEVQRWQRRFHRRDIQWWYDYLHRCGVHWRHGFLRGCEIRRRRGRFRPREIQWWKRQLPSREVQRRRGYLHRRAVQRRHGRLRGRDRNPTRLGTFPANWLGRVTPKGKKI